MKNTLFYTLTKNNIFRKKKEEKNKDQVSLTKSGALKN